MVQISKQPQSPLAKQRLWQKVVDVLHHSPSQASTDHLLSGILSPTEQIVIANRLVAAALLLSNWHPYEVSRLFNLSTATVYKIKNQLESNPAYLQEIRRAFPQDLEYQEAYKSYVDASVIVDQLFKQNTSIPRVIYNSIG